MLSCLENTKFSYAEHNSLMAFQNNLEKIKIDNNRVSPSPWKYYIDEVKVYNWPRLLKKSVIFTCVANLVVTVIAVDNFYKWMFTLA